jgi:hypothetical protein
MNNFNTGIDKNKNLTLRVSAGVLVKILFKDPVNNKTMLALERTASLRKINGKFEAVVQAKPFGGGIRIINPNILKEYIGDFNFDSKESKQEKDFRILINPGSWDTVKKICLNHLKEPVKKIIDTSPERELREEFKDSLRIKLAPDQYSLKPLGMAIEEKPDKTENNRSPGIPTVRIYYLYEALIVSIEIVKMILKNSREITDNHLMKTALQDKRNGGKGRGNAILTLEPCELLDAYNSLPYDKLNKPVYFREHLLAGNVPAIMEEIMPYKYHSIKTE